LIKYCASIDAVIDEVGQMCSGITIRSMVAAGFFLVVTDVSRRR
jgi:hypothetical protein